jgi:hypothetical protein
VRKSAVAFVLLLISSILPGGSAAGPQPANQSAWNGHWKLNIQKSFFANVPIPQHASLIIHADENKIMWETRGVDAGGHPYDYRFDGKLDDKPYTVRGASSSTTISFKRENGTLVSRWKDAQGERVSITTVSPDGKTLTVKNTGTDAEQTSNWTEVWDRALK